MSTLVFGASDLGTGAGTVYLPPGFSPAAKGNAIAVTVPEDGTLSQLHVRHNSPIGPGTEVIAYTVRVNGSDTDLSASLAADTANSRNQEEAVDVVEGDRVELVADKGTGLTASVLDAVVSMDFS